MRISSFISFVGFATVLIATFCPLAHFLFVHKTIYSVNQPYGMIILLITVVGIIGCVFRNKNLTKLMAWLTVGLMVLLFIAAIFKMTHYFNFMPFHWGSESLNSHIHFDWGWYLMLVGTILALAGTFANKPTTISAQSKTDQNS
jgi:hypothetical protein